MNQIKGFYWTPSRDSVREELQLLERMGARAVYVPYHSIDQIRPAELHNLGIQLYVDFTIFAGESWWKSFPDSVPVDSSGDLLTPDEWYFPVCPNHPGVRRQNLSWISMLLQNYSDHVDGIWLDFIRYPARWEVRSPSLRNTCFCKHCLNLFLNGNESNYSKAETIECAKYIVENKREEWTEWKCSRVTSFVKEAKLIVATAKKPILLGMFSLPWRETDYGGAMRSIVGQDLADLAEYVDVISPMTYHKLCHQEPEWITRVIRDVQRWTKKRVLPVVQSLDHPTPISAHEFDAVLAHTLDAQTDGVMIFTLEPLLNNLDKQTIVHKHFS